MKQTAQDKSKKKKENLKDRNNALERSYRFSLLIIELVDNLQRNNSSIIIGKQLLRSATSVGANIIEAQAGSSKKDFTNYITIALKSSNETKYWLGLLRDSKRLGKISADELIDENQQISKILGSIIVKLKKSVYK